MVGIVLNTVARVKTFRVARKENQRKMSLTRLVRRNNLFRAGLFLLAAAGTAIGADGTATKLSFMVPMRDGVKLATDIYLPNTNGAFPALLSRTPYNKGIMTAAGEDGARHGYATVLQDTRGRFASEGENLPFEADGWAGHWDGYDTVEWIVRQPWCNRKIGTFGGSAGAITQLLLAGSGNTNV